MKLLHDAMNYYFKDSMPIEKKIKSDIENDELKLKEAQFRLKYNLEVKATLMNALSNASSYRNINYFKNKLDSANRSIKLSKMEVSMYQRNIKDFQNILDEI